MIGTLTILHPGVEHPHDAKPRLAPRLQSFAGKRVALLDNGKVNASVMIGAIADRISFVPRYRQKVRFIPGRLANPVWVDDEDFVRWIRDDELASSSAAASAP